MGTSVSHSSPRTSNWKPVHICYTSNKISEDNTLREIWRAADNPSESIRWSTEMKSDIIYSCFEKVKSSSNIQEALTKFNAEVLSTKTNSIAAELAKRAIPISFQAIDPSSGWVNKFFSEVTKYLISRDTSGFVGENYRNKNVKDLEGFKERLLTNLNHHLSTEKIKISNRSEWNNFIDKTVFKLKTR
jgi:hypothetical protein